MILRKQWKNSIVEGSSQPATGYPNKPAKEWMTQALKLAGRQGLRP